MSLASNAMSAPGAIDGRSEADTIRLWENYREQALMWRALALLQIPATFIALVFALWIWNTRSITLEVPAKPLPGRYLANEIPDAEFVEAATGFINLIATYQPAVARRQFEHARQMLLEPMLSRFDAEMVGVELKAIETTRRTQIFFVDPTSTSIERSDTEVIVSLVGDRLKIVAGKELPPATTKFLVKMTTIPRNDLNPYGIVITDIAFENLER